MTGTLEREIKLRFATPEQARAAVLASGGVPLRPRRLQSDVLLDNQRGDLRAARSALRVRIEDGRAWLTFKGAVQTSSMKVREELETSIGDGALLIGLLERLGFYVWFRYEKYREEFALGQSVVAVDETPVGTYVEIEGPADDIHAAALALGRTPSDYIVASYRGLYVEECTRRGVTASNMVFEIEP